MEIFGKYNTTVYRRETSGFTIFKFKLNDFIPEFETNLITCKGKIASSFIGLPLKVSGQKQTDKYGEFFEVETVEPHLAVYDDAVDFLSSACFKGISERLAKKIIDVIGPNVFELINKPNAYQILTEIDEIGSGKAKTVMSVLNQTKAQNELLEFILQFGGSFINSEKLSVKYGVNAIDKLKNNPYKAGTSCDIDFFVCDKIAKECGFSEFSEERIKALIMHVMDLSYEKGNMYLPLDRLIKNINYHSRARSAFIGKNCSIYQIISVLKSMNNIILEECGSEVRCYLKKAYFDETRIAKNIKRIQKTKHNYFLNIPKLINEIETNLKIKYSDKQKECFSFLSSDGLKVITGGPGTGKSTVINGLTYAYQKLYPTKSIVMMAPTGRAAQRINEITGKEAGTIHRMFGLTPFNEEEIQAKYYANYPADMIIVDEASMIDCELMSMLSECVKNGSLVIMVGDIDQLPSVGAGAVLRDLINCNYIETVKLDVNYRQRGKSLIIDNAIAINNGSSVLTAGENFSVKEFKSADELARNAEELFTALYEPSNPFSVQILCPSINGPAGIREINKNVQKYFIKGKKIIANSEYDFKVGDKVMAKKNNYDVGYFNGDIGIIKDYNDVSVTIVFNKNLIEIPRQNMEDIQLAYACTIHKSQGSEYNSVIICLPSEPKCMIKRNLLYTAITRAKQNVYIFTQKGCIKTAAETKSDNQRTSGVIEKIIKYMEV